MVVVLASQAAGLLAVTIVATVGGHWADASGYVPWAITAGLVGVVGLLAFYEALASGTMGIVSPIAALSVIVPVTAGLVTGHWPSLLVGAGLLLAIVGVVAASGPEHAAGRSLRPVILATVAAVCFGAVLILIAQGARSSAVMTMVGMRVASVTALTAVIVMLRRSLWSGRNSLRTGREWHTAAIWTTVVIAGLFDVSANLAYAAASQLSALTIVAVLGSLYPAVTVVLARLIHGERMSALQHVGVTLAITGVVIIAGGS